MLRQKQGFSHCGYGIPEDRLAVISHPMTPNESATNDRTRYEPPHYLHHSYSTLALQNILEIKCNANIP